MNNSLTEVFVTYDPMEANLIKAKLADENIPYAVTGDNNVTMTMEIFNSSLSRMAMKQPIKFFVESKYYEIALTAINTDRSTMLGDDLEY